MGQIQVNWRKGKVLQGPFGVGKTTLMKTIQNSKRDQTKWISTSQLCNEVRSNGEAVIDQYAKTACLFIDDLGSQSEPTTVTHFGTEINPVHKLIEDRYYYVVHTQHSFPGCQLRMGWNEETKRYDTRHPESFFETYISTNLSFDQLVEKYGGYIVDRLVEMCDFEKMEGNSYRQ